MDKTYEVFCFVDPRFYDTPASITHESLEFALGTREAPPEWTRTELDDWIVYWPEHIELPAQGWKVHASARLDNADAVLSAVWDYCVPRQLAFKFVRGPHYLFMRNAKYADRGSSGKLAAIFPTDEAQLETILRELGTILEGQEGPYILSDLRWDNGPLYVRYGGFAERYCINPSGEAELAIADETGQLVPDRRGPVFEIPPWVSLPAFLEPHLEARNEVAVTDLPYRIDRALHFSNGGGLYHAVDERNGKEVVLKEARPHAGLALDGADAVTRLQRERDVLKRLSGLDVVPELLDYFVFGEHHFLAQSFVDAQALTAMIAERYPLTLEDPGEDALAAYAAWAQEVIGRVERAVDAIHGRGVAIGDLHPSNVMVRPDGEVMLVDFEIACGLDEVRPQTLADPGFLVPAGLSAGQVDRYALACLRLSAFLPLTELVALEPAKAQEFASVIAELFPVPRKFVTEAASFITTAASPSQPKTRRGRPGRPRIDAEPNCWPALRDSMAEAILSSATPERADRLFPGDIQQFSTGGLNLAYGAAGVLYALMLTGAERHPEHEDWLVEKATHPAQGSRLGFYDGLHGVAYTLEVLDRRADALKVLGFCADDVGGRWEELGLDLYAGLAGIGLNLAHFAALTGDPSLHDDARRVVEVLADRIGDETTVAEVSGGEHAYAGLLRGSSGPALLFLHHYDHSGDDHLLDLAATALRQDLRRCYLRDDGSLEVNEGWRTMPYLADGSVGIGFVLDQYLARRDDEFLAYASNAISRAARGQFYIEPGLFYGRAGMILYLGRRHPTGEAGLDPAVAAQVHRMNWHALGYEGHLAFPGEQLMRLSMDLGSGTAGVLLALGSVLHSAPVHLPFLSPRPTRVEPTGGASRHDLDSMNQERR